MYSGDFMFYDCFLVSTFAAGFRKRKKIRSNLILHIFLEVKLGEFE